MNTFCRMQYSLKIHVLVKIYLPTLRCTMLPKTQFCRLRQWSFLCLWQQYGAQYCLEQFCHLRRWSYKCIYQHYGAQCCLKNNFFFSHLQPFLLYKHFQHCLLNTSPVTSHAITSYILFTATESHGKLRLPRMYYYFNVILLL